MLCVGSHINTRITLYPTALKFTAQKYTLSGWMLDRPFILRADKTFGRDSMSNLGVGLKKHLLLSLTFAGLEFREYGMEMFCGT